MVHGRIRLNPDPTVGAQYMAAEIAKRDPFQQATFWDVQPLGNVLSSIEEWCDTASENPYDTDPW